MTIGEIEAGAAKRNAREEKEVVELYKAFGEREVLRNYTHLTSSDLSLTRTSPRNSLSTLMTHNQAYINVDELLAECVSSSKGDGRGKSSRKSSGETEKRGNIVEFMKRDELLKGIVDKMQPRYEIRAGRGEGHGQADGGGSGDDEVVTKKGKLSPIQVMKIRQGRKASTLITGFEPFGKVIGGMEPEDLAEDLRKICAGATSVSPIPGKSAANAGMEVLVQGKQSKVVVDYLIGKGVPKKWIEVKDLVGKK
ncbi:hypothetical protein GYMLUDRAFT_258511 [Collybiopsis luxurians FD-317 M1]|nr:hypothetical protein GYMLUDRAFT_258511 [Collybiopsis luxurians FD-317 M1]